jgi:hypothetical protein
VDADCFPRLEAQGAEAGGELADYGAGLAGGDGVGGVEGVDVDLRGMLVLGSGFYLGEGCFGLVVAIGARTYRLVPVVG